jgi:hypothetical protein
MMLDTDDDNAPTYVQQVRQENLLLIRLSIRQGFMPSRDRLRKAMSGDEWRGYLAGVAPPPEKKSKKDASEPRLSTYFLLLVEADKLQRRVDRTSVKRRRMLWQDLRERTGDAYLQAFKEFRRVLKTSPEVAVGMFPPFVDPPHPLGPGRSEMPRVVTHPVAPKPPLGPTAPDDFTRLYVESLIEPAPTEDPSDQ